MKRIGYVFIAALLLLPCAVSTAAEDTPAKVNYDKLNASTLEKVKQQTSFKLVVPKNIPKDWTVELKDPYPLDRSKPIEYVRLHYFDKDENYMFGIEFHKATGYKAKREILDIDVQKKTNTVEIIEEDFTFDWSGEATRVNGTDARFTRWADNHIGGYLRWVQNGTYIEMESSQLSKKEMLKIAKSVQ